MTYAAKKRQKFNSIPQNKAHLAAHARTEHKGRTSKAHCVFALAASLFLVVGLLPSGATAALATNAAEQAPSLTLEAAANTAALQAQATDGVDNDSALQAQTIAIEEGPDGTVSQTNPLWNSSAEGTLYKVTLQSTGLYSMVVLGAKGGDVGSSGGLGGTTQGVTEFTAGSVIYACTGGSGQQNVSTTGGQGGANGGGNGGNGAYYGGEVKAGGAGGGGASHIAREGSLLGLRYTSDEAIILVAGGGGGCGASLVGGVGGGASGGNSELQRSEEEPGWGGTQESGANKGYGSNGWGGRANKGQGAEGRGGGGGGYWGGQGGISEHNASGAGGSGFLNATYFGNGTKSADGSTVTRGSTIVASTEQGGNDAGGSISVAYLASIITLDNQGAATAGTQTLYAAPNADSYYTSYSVEGLGSAVQKITIPTKETAFTYFDGYYTQPNHGGTRYIAPDGTVEAGLYTQGTTKLYAAWGVQVKFDDNGTEIATMPATQTIEQGTTATKPSDPPPTNGLWFKGWSTNKDSYEEVDFSTFAFQEDTTLYAFWIPYEFTVNFNANGGEGTMAPQTIPGNTATALSPNAFAHEGYEFAGWNTAADGSGTQFADKAEVTDLAEAGGTITLYAQWKDLSAVRAAKLATTSDSLLVLAAGFAALGAMAALALMLTQRCRSRS